MKKLIVLMFVMAATAVNAWVDPLYCEYAYQDAYVKPLDDILYILKHNEDPRCPNCLRNEKCTEHTIKLTKEEEITLLKEYIREYHICKILNIESYEELLAPSHCEYRKKWSDIIQRLIILTGNRSIDDELYKEVKKEREHYLKLIEKIKGQQEALENFLEKRRRRLHNHALIEECGLRARGIKIK